MNLTRTTGILCAGLAALAWLGQPARAEAGADTFPSQPISLIVPYPAGGTTDIQARQLATSLSETLGVQVMVLNRPGVSGTLGPAQMARTARPDGYTLSIIGDNHARMPATGNASYHPVDDFTFLAHVTEYTLALVVRDDAPWKDLPALVEDARNRPGSISYGTSGVGTSGNLAMERLAAATGTAFNFVPFKGGSELYPALVGGHIDIVSAAGFGPTVDAGRARLLTLLSEENIASRPGVPTARSYGIDAVAHAGWGLVGPAGLPANVVKTLHSAIQAAINHPGIIAMLNANDQPVKYLGPDDYKAFIQQQFEHELALAQNQTNRP